MIAKLKDKILLVAIFAQSSFGFAQTSVITKDYHQIKGDVIEAEEYRFFESEIVNEPSLNSIQNIQFKDDLVILIKEVHPKFKIAHHYTFTHTKPFEEFTMHYQRFKNGEQNIDSTTTFQSVKYKSLTFFYPEDSLQVTKSKSPLNDRMEVSFKLNNKKETRWLETASDSTITETIYNGNGREMTYHKNGNLVEKLYPYRTVNEYHYNDLGFIISEVFNDKLMNRNYMPPIITKYFYQYDVYGNWIKKLAVNLSRKYTNPKPMVSLSVRKITYKDGIVTGSILYDSQFVKRTCSTLKN